MRPAHHVTCSCDGRACFGAQHAEAAYLRCRHVFNATWPSAQACRKGRPPRRMVGRARTGRPHRPCGLHPDRNVGRTTYGHRESTPGAWRFRCMWSSPGISTGVCLRPAIVSAAGLLPGHDVTAEDAANSPTSQRRRRGSRWTISPSPTCSRSTARAVTFYTTWCALMHHPRRSATSRSPTGGLLCIACTTTTGGCNGRRAAATPRDPPPRQAPADRRHRGCVRRSQHGVGVARRRARQAHGRCPAGRRL